MKKMNMKDHGMFSVVSHTYVLYGHKYSPCYAYIHFEDSNGTTYMVDGFPWRDVIALVRGRISWMTFGWRVAYDYYQQETENGNE